VSAFVWLLGLAYLYVELTTDERAMGAFVTVLLAALAILPALNPQIDERPALLRSPLFTIHVLSMLLAYASFALAFVLGITYVLLFKEIKAKHLGYFYARLPSLQTPRPDERPRRSSSAGCFLTAGLIVGASGRRRSEDRRIRARRRCTSPIRRSCSR
jgi:ABC-type transport system involved in cytochrome c biogenesis permease subunit